MGVGTNLVWVDPDNDTVVVVRWIAPEAVDVFLGKVNAALTS